MVVNNRDVYCKQYCYITSREKRVVEISKEYDQTCCEKWKIERELRNIKQKNKDWEDLLEEQRKAFEKEITELKQQMQSMKDPADRFGMLDL